MINQPNALQTSTQKYLELFDITNDVVILQDGSVSMVMTSTAINFDLYSEEEQDAAIYAYAALLNSLSFPIEIVIRSQKKDVTSYLDLLKEAEIKAYNPISKRNIKDYREFVAELVQERNVLDKKFYIIITYTALEAGIISGSSFLPSIGKKAPPVLDKISVLEKALTNLEPRREHLIHQFARIGLFLQQVKTQELIQLFYTIYNPESSKGIKVVTAQEYATPLVQADVAPLPVIQAQMESIQGKTPTAPEPPTSISQQTPVPKDTSSLPTIEVSPSEPVELPNTPDLTAPTPPSELPTPTPPAPKPIDFSPGELMEESISIGSASDLTPPTPPGQTQVFSSTPTT